MSTKDEERKALEKIRKIVKDLGENSYVGTALDGALDLADQNIEYDAAFSARYYEEALTETENKLKVAEKRAAELDEMLATQRKIFDTELDELHERLLSSYENSMLTKLLTEKTSNLQLEVNNAAARIVEAANDPTSAAFKNAVSDHRTAQQELDSYTNVLKSIVRKGESV